MSCETACGKSGHESAKVELKDSTLHVQLIHQREHRMSPAVFLTVKEAAKRLGIQPTTLYDWLGLSRHGLLVIRGQIVTIDYFQSGAKGQGKIQIPASEIERLHELMRVPVQFSIPRKTPVRVVSYPGITVPLGRPSGP
jgi:transposase-like protein